MYTITYWELFSQLKTWFISRWGDILADDNSIMNYINFAIQDIYNQDSSTFRHKTERIVWVPNWNYNSYTTVHNIYKVQQCFWVPPWNNWYVDYWDNRNLIPTLFQIKDPSQIRFEWNIILSHIDVKEIEVTYLMDYEPIALNELTKPIPLPYRYIPAVMKLAFDWAAPVNLLSWETAQVDFYSHWMNRINTLSANDSVTDYIDVRPSY